MLNKSKVNISVILLAIGIGLLPTGFITSGFITDQIGENIPNTILHIHEEAISEIEAQYLGLGITEVLPVIKNQETKNIKDEIVEVRFIPSSLLYLKNLTMPLFLERINGSMTTDLIRDSLADVSEDILANINGPLSAQIINDTLEQVIISYSTTPVFARDLFFNNYTFQIDYDTSINGTSIKGVSEYATSSSNSINFTATAQERLLEGYLSYPGLIQDVENGTGILEFMELYENATIDPDTYNITMQNAYDSTWNQLTSLATYVSSYLWASVIPQTWNNTINPSEYATTRSKELFFNDEDWSSSTKNITPIAGISEYGTVELSNLSYSTIAQQRILYGNGDDPGILENEFLGQGVLDYLIYYEETSGNATIQSEYNATYYQLNNLTAYITQHIMEVIIPAQLALEGETLESAGLRDFYIQWTNASFFTDGIKINELSDEIGELLKARSAANELHDEIDTLLTDHNETVARDLFFNNYTFQINFSTAIKGVSEYDSGSTYSLNYTSTAQERLLDGYGTAPGIFTSIKSGFGLLNWLDFYDSALLNIGTNRTLMETTYNATWSTQLFPLGEYIRIYLLDTIIGAISQSGLEAGIPTATNLNYSTTASLWDPMNSNGIINDTGILKWYNAATGNLTIQDQLNATVNLTQNQFDQLYNWLITKAKNTLTPIVFIIQQPLGIRLTTGEYAGILFLEQWANATVIPGGINISGIVKGFEVGLPIQSNISYDTALALFDVGNSSSFIDTNGMLKWIDAFNGDLVAKNELIALFSLDSTQMNMILNWLFTSFNENVVPNIITDLTGYTMKSLVEIAFHRQWTNVSLFVNGIDLDPAFGLDSITGWEIGILDINLETSETLWDEGNSFSLVHQKGNGLWFQATRDLSVYQTLKDYHELDDSQMEAIIAWIGRIREEFSLPYLKEKLNLPIDVYTYANTVFLGFTISAVIFLALGCISIILIFLSKRR